MLIKKYSIVVILNIIVICSILVSCTDKSAGTVGPDGNVSSEATIEIQGLVSGPLSDPGKSFLSDSSSTEYNSGVSNISTDDIITSEIASSIAKTSVAGESPMPGVVVSIYELSDYISNQENASLLATTTTNSEGQYSVSEIEEGIDIVIVTDTNPRQTLLIINSEKDSSGDLNSATSIVSEYWAGELSDGTNFNQADFDELLETAGNLLEGMSAEELQSLLTELVPENFGEGFPENLSSEARYFVGTLTGIDLAACEDIEFSTESARPGTIINPQNLPANLGEDPFAWSYIDEEEEIYPVYLGASEDDEWELLVPMHPVNHMDGGDVKIFIESEDAQVRCGDYSIEIEPLDPAPGTFKSMVDEFESTAISITEMIGYSREELLSKNMNELDSYAAVMKSVLTLIGGPEYPGSLQYTLNNDTSKEILDIYDAILSELLTSDGMGKQIISGNSEVAFFPDFNPCEIPLNGLASGSIFSPTPKDLDCWMNVNRVFEDFIDNEFQDHHDNISRTFVFHDLFPVGPMEDLRGEIMGYLEFMEMMLASFEYLFPSELLGIDLEGNPLLYNYEDDGTRGRWKGSIYAEPKDWEFDILQAIGTLPIPSAGAGAGIISKVMKQSDDFQKFVEGYVDNIQGEIQGTGIGEFTFEAQVFGPIDIKSPRDEDYFTWELNTTSKETNIDPFSFTQDEQAYTPEAVGTADLRVETKGGDVFKGQKVFNILELEVQPINITLVEYFADSDTTYVSPIYIGVDEELTLEAAVENARNKEVAWSVSPEGSGLSLTDWHVEPATGIKDVIAKEPGRYTVEVESIADTGPRADNNPRRYDRVTVVVGGLNVSNPGCVEVGNTYQLTASIGGEAVDFSELEWDINGPGSIDSDGVYSAGGTGDVQINFQVIGQPEITDTVSFTVSEMCSSFTISSPKFNFSGTCVGYEELPGTNRTAIYFDPAFKQPSGQLIIKEILSDVMSTTESWTVSDPGWIINSFVQSGLEWPSKTWAYAPDENLGAGGSFTLNQVVKEYDATNVRVLGGSFSAEFRWDEIEGDEIIERLDPVTIDFAGALPPGENNSNHECLANGGF